MATTRKIKEAKDLSSGELIYFNGHAKATYMSDGSTVEDSINQLKNNSGSGDIAIPQIVYVPNESSMPNPPVEGVLYLIGNEVLKQVIQLKSGWNYVSFYLDGAEGESGIESLKQQLGNNGIQIKNYNSATTQFEDEGQFEWRGSLEAISLEQPYAIKVNEDQTIEFSGNIINPENYIITITTKLNWVPYMYNTQRTLSDVLVNFTPVVGDYIKTFEDTTVLSTYTESGWDTDIILVPGEAYVYYNNSSETKTLIFPKL